MRQYFVIIPLLIIGLLFVFGGCERDIKGPERINVKPVVNFVNIPVADALFSSDTTIYGMAPMLMGLLTLFITPLSGFLMLVAIQTHFWPAVVYQPMI